MKLKQLASAVILATFGGSAVAATYELTPVPVQDLSFDNYATSIDDTGTMIVTLEDEYNPPIDLDLIDFDSDAIVASFEDANAVERGVFSDYDYQVLYYYLLSQRQSGYTGYQSLAQYRSYATDTLDADAIHGFDEYSDDFGEYSRSAYSLVYDSHAGDYYVGIGNGAFFEVDYETDDGDEYTYVLNDRYIQAFVEVNNQTKALPPIEDEPYYGFSAAYAINDNLQVAGYGSVEVLDSYVESSEDCEDSDDRGDQPEELCNYNLFSSLATATYRRALVWQLDALGNVMSTTEYGLAIDPVTDSTAYYSLARDINNNGVAVGVSSTDDADGDGYDEVAVAFVDGEVLELLNQDENLQSDAVGVNDDDWAIGTVTRENNGYVRDYMFIHNIDSGETLYPDGFFETAATNPRAINNNGIVVGEGEFEADVQTNREVRAFMYDIDTDEFTNLNDLLSCSQQAEYTLVSAVDINDNDEIIANALIRDTQRYISGEEVIDSTGEATEVDRVVAVKLTLTGSGSIEDCTSEEDENYERQGASASWWSLLGLFGVVAFRLRRRLLA